MQIIEDVEMKTLLGFPVVTKAEPYVPPPSRWTAPVDGSGLGSPVGSGGGQTSLLIAGLHTHTYAFYSSHISSKSIKDTSSRCLPLYLSRFRKCSGHQMLHVIGIPWPRTVDCEQNTIGNEIVKLSLSSSLQHASSQPSS